MWTLDLNKLQHWKLVKEVSVPGQDFKGPGAVESSDGEDDGADGDED